MMESSPKAVRALRTKSNRARRQALQPPPTLSVPDWADKYRRLSSSAGAIGGPWRTSRFEIARGAMMAVKEPGVETITVMCATQTMKTELLLNIVGYHAHLDPCPMLLVQPKEDAAKKFSKERLAPMAKATPVLSTLLRSDRERGGEDTIFYKTFPGGFLAVEGAGSPTNLAMRPIRITLQDETDKYESTKEGDPVLLAEERTATYRLNRLMVRVCSPTWEESSRIWDSYKASDMRRAFVKCPHCKYRLTLDFFKHVHWAKSEDGEHFPATAAIICENCGVEWSEAERLKLITTKCAIRWYQTRPFVCCDERQEPMKTRKWKWDSRHQVGRAACIQCAKLAVPNTHAGFQASKLYSPIITVLELATKWIDEKDNPESKQVFYNTRLGLPFEVHALKKIEGQGLSTRRHEYAAVVPRGVLVITAGVDVQPGSTVSEGRLEVEVVGWGLGEESWSIEHKVFLGDPAKPDVWAELDAYLQQPFEYEGGGQMVIRGTCIDSGGHNTNEVYKFCRARLPRNVWAIKGAADRSGQWSPIWPVPKLEKRKTRMTGYRPVILGVNAAKESIRQKLLVDQIGPGYCHFRKDTPDVIFDQLSSETLMLEKKQGYTHRKWVLPRGRANEALDCRVYAYAALCGLYAVRKLNLDRVSEMVQTFFAKDHPTEEPTSEEAPPLPALPSKPVRNRVRRSSFVG